MAGLQHRYGTYRIIFRYRGKQHAFTLGEVSKDEAEKKAAQVNYLLMRLRQRLVTLPPAVGIVEYVQFDGRPVVAEATSAKLTLWQFRARYLATYENSLEANTLATARVHIRHLIGHLGEAFPIAEIFSGRPPGGW